MLNEITKFLLVLLNDRTTNK